MSRELLSRFRKLDNDMALKTKSVTVGPVALVCITVSFLAILALFAYLFVIVPDRADIYVRVLIPTLTSIGAAAAVYIKAHSVQQNNTLENETINNNVIAAAEKAEDVQKTVDRRLNGELDGRIQEAISKALVSVQSPDKEVSH